MNRFTANPEFERFIKMAGGAVNAARQHDIPESLISLVRNGKRDVSKSLAKKIIDAYPGEFSLSRLLFPEKDEAA